MNVKQQEDDDQKFVIVVDEPADYRENFSDLMGQFGSSPSPRMQEKRLAAVHAYQRKVCMNSPIVTHASALDNDCKIIHRSGLVVEATFATRSAAAWFKLTYC